MQLIKIVDYGTCNIIFTRIIINIIFYYTLVIIYYEISCINKSRPKARKQKILAHETCNWQTFSNGKYPPGQVNVLTTELASSHMWHGERSTKEYNKSET